MRRVAALAVLPLVIAAHVQAQGAVARQKPLPVRTAHEAAVRTALREATRTHDATVADWVRIAKVGALPGKEQARAQLVKQMFVDAGVAARILPDGNVEARIPGTGTGSPAVLSAHLDALHEPTADSSVRIQDGVMTGPAVLDDASGLAALVRSARLLAASGWKPQREVRFVATVGEEIGLAGAKSYIGANPNLAAFVTIDGILGAVDYGATGIRWTRFTLTGRGGHTLLADRTPSPSFAAGRAIASIAALAEETDAPINVSQLVGDSPPNAIPTSVSFTVDARSDDPDELTHLSRDIERVVKAAADREGVTLAMDTLQDLPAAALPGHEKSPLVVGAIDILTWLDVQPTAAQRGSADHNIALLHRIPGIAVGATLGRHAHAPEETADVKMLERGVRQAILLCVLLGESLPEPLAAAQ